MKNHTAKDYLFENTLVRYIIMNETKAVFMLIVPKNKKMLLDDTFHTVQLRGEYPDNMDWFPGSIVHLHLSHHINSSYGNSLKFSQSVKSLKFSHQQYIEKNGCREVKTFLLSDEGFEICHILKNYLGEVGFSVKTVFKNNSKKTVTLEMISSASLDNLSPFVSNDSSKNLVFHTFKGGWSVEGKHIETTLCEMNMEKSWGGSFESERIGSVGSKSVGRYFPYVVLEDRPNKCSWGLRIKHNATWQAELTRYGAKISVSAGIGDLNFGGWFKNVESGGCFEAPEAFIAVANGDVADVSNILLNMKERDGRKSEEEMSVVFNEWCTTWGKPSQDYLLKIADRLKESMVKYFVVDAGWFKGGNGCWEYNEKFFPNGMAVFSEEIRKRGMIPGLWMEFECVDQSSERFSNKYDGLYLSKFNIPLCGTINNSFAEKFLDFSNPDTIAFLDRAVIKFLKDNKIGYLKVDYNTNTGIGCDGAESLGEGLRQHMQRVYEFFLKIKKEIPDIIIENCSSGGSRLDAKMIAASDMSSFSDAHEAFEIPVIAANLQYLVPPEKCQIWCVLRNSFGIEHMKYICCCGFLGRLCWSGDIDRLDDVRFEMMLDAEKLYSEVSHIIKDGVSRIYRTDENYNYRDLCGTQAVVRYSKNKSELLVVYHCFNMPKKLEITIERGFKIKKSLYESKTIIEKDKICIDTCTERCGNVLYLKKE